MYFAQRLDDVKGYVKIWHSDRVLLNYFLKLAGFARCSAFWRVIMCVRKVAVHLGYGTYIKIKRVQAYIDARWYHFQRIL
jgi:hypothetical protein